MTEYVEPLPYPFTMIECDGKVNPSLDEKDREEEWGDILRAIENMGLWPHTQNSIHRGPDLKPNTAESNKIRLNAIRAIESPRSSYAPRKRRSINK